MAQTVVKVTQGLWQLPRDMLFCNTVQTVEGDSSQPIKSYSKATLHHVPMIKWLPFPPCICDTMIITIKKRSLKDLARKIW